MSEYVMMEKSDLVEIGDCVRELDGSTGKIVADNLSRQLKNAISTVGNIGGAIIDPTEKMEIQAGKLYLLDLDKLIFCGSPLKDFLYKYDLYGNGSRVEYRLYDMLFDIDNLDDSAIEGKPIIYTFANTDTNNLLYVSSMYENGDQPYAYLQILCDEMTLFVKLTYPYHAFKGHSTDKISYEDINELKNDNTIHLYTGIYSTSYENDAFFNFDPDIDEALTTQKDKCLALKFNDYEKYYVLDSSEQEHFYISNNDMWDLLVENLMAGNVVFHSGEGFTDPKDSTRYIYKNAEYGFTIDELTKTRISITHNEQTFVFEK